MNHRILAVCLALASSCLAAATHAAPPLDDWLKKPILDPDTGLTEVKKYCAAKVPPVPEATSVEQWEQHAKRIRQETLDKVVHRGAAAAWRDQAVKVEWSDEVPGGVGYTSKKLRYEILPGMWIPAILYTPEKLTGPAPVIMNVNGHDRNGKAADYKQIRCINLAKRGMIVLNPEWVGMGQLNVPGFGHYKMNQLDLCGTSGLAPFYLSMKKGLDVLLAQEHADPQRVAVAGLSGGGWQTIVISSLDERVTLSNPVAGYSSFITRAGNFMDLGDSEQTPVDLATTGDYAALTALRAPRPTLLTFNGKDQCCFRAGHALPPLMDAAGPIYKLYGKPEALRSHVNEDPGDHNFGLDNRQQLYRMIGDFFFAGDDKFTAVEIPCEKELKTLEELKVAVPDDNHTFNTLATQLAAELPRGGNLPAEKDQFGAWIKEGRTKLAAIVKAKSFEATADPLDKVEQDGISATFWKLKLGADWTVPVVELTPEKPMGSTIIFSEEGRASLSEPIQQLLAKGQRVYAVDPFFYGESKISKLDFLFGLLLSAVGDRPLGLQASQIAATARWIKSQHGDQPVAVATHGPRASLIALTAAGLEHSAIASVELTGSLGSLKQVFEENRGVDSAPELFTFGLLEQFDVIHLAALAAPRPVTFRAASDRMKQEAEPLKKLYKTLGVEHEPVK